MASQPPTRPDRIEPQSPPETIPAAPEPYEPWPDESEPMQPDFEQPGETPQEFP